MNNSYLLKQARKAIRTKIAESPTIINIITYPEIDNGFGGTMLDTENPVNVKKTVRISHEKNIVPKNEVKPSGSSTNLGRFILADYQTELIEGYLISDFAGREYKIGPVDPLYQYGGIKGYQAPLSEGSNA